MADTDTETLPNGTGALSEEDERMKQRPADIDADVREMERRKRVEALMSSRLFREELERVLDQQLHEGGDAPLLQRIREMVGGRLHTGSFRGPSCVLPINDIRGIEGVGYEKGEKILRCKLAAVYRLVDLFGWTQTGISGQVTARLNTAVEQILTTPRGLLPHEVTASSLVKVDIQGAVQDPGTTNFPPNQEGFSVHGAVHAARPDVRCVVHVRSAAALAVSAMKRGLLPLCDEACVLGEIAYHRVPHGILDNEEQEKLVRALGPHAKVLILSSGGALCCGATLEEAFFQARNLTAACDVQLRLASLPVDELQLIDEDTKKQIFESSRKPPADQAKWRVGGEEFEALMRMLDNAGFRTGYIYRHPLIKNEAPKPKSDVEVPPAVSSLGYLLEEEELYRQGVWKRGTGRGGERTRWLNSPNVYQKVELLETGTTDPRKITKWVDANNEEWVQDGSPAHSSTPVKIDTLQFVPKNTNPKEFKALQQQIKDNRRADKISAGPQSHILEGVTWDEAARLVGEDAHNTHTGDHVVLMGAASKGIIQRGYQHNATVYSAPYARNPFDHISDREIDEYRRTVERKQRSDYDTDFSESEALQITSPASARSETEEESRDEHRVLRIETKQVPVRSQPEVVLSDDPNLLPDDEVFADSPLASSVTSPVVIRAQHTVVREIQRDPNLLSDDEVFYDTPISPTTSSMTSPEPIMTEPKIVHMEPKIMRTEHNVPQTIVVVGRTVPNSSAAETVMMKDNIVIKQTQQRTLRGTLTTDERSLTEALSSNKRNQHDFARNTKFEDVMKIFESPENINLQNVQDTQKHPKCKVSLASKLTSDVNSMTDVNSDVGLPKLYDKNAFDVTSKSTDMRSGALALYQGGNASSRSSLSSIPSLEWDGRCKSDNLLRTSSLPRKFKCSMNKIYRSQSHSGFVNYYKDPEPSHFHLPRCRSCGATNSSYTWELTKEEKKNKTPCSLFYSVDNLHQKCLDEAKNLTKLVKVTERFVPVFKVANVQGPDSEFVESQEFTEDNYLGDIGNSFSSENQTVIEATVKNDARVVKADSITVTDTPHSDTYRAEPVTVSGEVVNINNNTMESIGGEYHSFTDDMDFEEAVYVSPVKELVEKDIRDYSVPIDFYCADYKNDSPKKSPQKRVDSAKLITLEPILEESKSSYDDSGNTSNDTMNLKVDISRTNKIGTHCSDQDSPKQFLFEDLNKDVMKEATPESVNIKVSKSTWDLLGCPKTVTEHFKKNLNMSNCSSKYDAQNDSEIDSNISYMNVMEIQENKDEWDFIIESKDYSGQVCAETCKEEWISNEKFMENIVAGLLNRAEIAAKLKEEILHCETKMTTEMLETEFLYGKDTFILNEDESELTYNEIESGSNVVQTAMDLYSNGDEDQDLDNVIIESVYDNMIEILSIDAIPSKLLTNTTECSSSSTVELKTFNSTTEFERLEDIAEVLTDILNKVDVDEENQETFYKSLKENSLTSTIDFKSFDSTDEFEKYEVIAEVVAKILNHVNTTIDNKISIIFSKEKTSNRFDIQEIDSDVNCTSNENQSDMDRLESKSLDSIDIEIAEVLGPYNNVIEEPNKDYVKKSRKLKSKSTRNDGDKFEINSHTEVFIIQKCDDEDGYNCDLIRDIQHESVDTLSDSEMQTSIDDGFSIMKMIQEIELTYTASDTTTESSDVDYTFTHKLVEGIIYYMFDQVFVTLNQKSKLFKRKKSRRVITVVDFEDILLTTSPLLLGNPKTSEEHLEDTESYMEIDDSKKTSQDFGEPETQILFKKENILNFKFETEFVEDFDKQSQCSDLPINIEENTKECHENQLFEPEGYDLNNVLQKSERILEYEENKGQLSAYNISKNDETPESETKTHCLDETEFEYESKSVNNKNLEQETQLKYFKTVSIDGISAHETLRSETETHLNHNIENTQNTDQVEHFVEVRNTETQSSDISKKLETYQCSDASETAKLIQNNDDTQLLEDGPQIGTESVAIKDFNYINSDMIQSKAAEHLNESGVLQIASNVTYSSCDRSSKTKDDIVETIFANFESPEPPSSVSCLFPGTDSVSKSTAGFDIAENETKLETENPYLTDESGLSIEISTISNYFEIIDRSETSYETSGEILDFITKQLSFDVSESTSQEFGTNYKEELIENSGVANLDVRDKISIEYENNKIEEVSQFSYEENQYIKYAKGIGNLIMNDGKDINILQEQIHVTNLDDRTKYMTDGTIFEERTKFENLKKESLDINPQKEISTEGTKTEFESIINSTNVTVEGEHLNFTGKEEVSFANSKEESLNFTSDKEINTEIFESDVVNTICLTNATSEIDNLNLTFEKEVIFENSKGNLDFIENKEIGTEASKKEVDSTIYWTNVVSKSANIDSTCETEESFINSKENLDFTDEKEIKPVISGNEVNSSTYLINETFEVYHLDCEKDVNIENSREESSNFTDENEISYVSKHEVDSSVYPSKFVVPEETNFNITCEKELSFGNAKENKDFIDEKEISTDISKNDETYVIPDMNIAFLETDYSRSSSPNRESSLFETCNESPIKNTNKSFEGEDLSVLYEKDDTILGSPFVKQPSVLSMSQCSSSGGIKYWLSFDDNLSEVKGKPNFRSVRRSKECDFPSFVTVDFNNKKKKRQEFYLRDESPNIPDRRSSVFDFYQSDDTGTYIDDINKSDSKIWSAEDNSFKRKSVLLEEFDQSKETCSKIEETFVTCASTDYYTCESELSSKYECQNPTEKKRMLIYDTRVDLHTKTFRRQYASWPPFEDTLFYRIISQFRMSESFDPNDFEELQIDNSL